MPISLPFMLEWAYGRVDSYAVHPSGKSIFVSVLGDRNLPVRTYSHDTESHTWMYLGTWMLPFFWQGHYDDELDAWVGVHQDNIAKLCCCDIPASLGPGGGSIPQPAWKLCEERTTSCRD
jgi:hypothetical protein